MIKIKNKRELINNSRLYINRKARKLALRGIEAALDAADPKVIIRSKVVLKHSLLKIEDCIFDLRRFRNIYVVGGGKASGSMAEALEEVLGEKITDGILNVPNTDCEYKIRRIKLQKASHPVPDKFGLEGTRRILNIARDADDRDLIICLISGGGSSLMPLPRDEISLQDKIVVTKLLLKSGATINEINTIRKHISDFKGGGLAKCAYPATVVNLLLSDVVGDPLECIASGPTVPDSSTFHDAVKVLKRYELWSEAPESVKKVLLEGEKKLVPETPKADDKYFRRVYSFVVGNNRSASIAAYDLLRSAGVNTLFLTSYLEGEARNVGRILAAIASEIVRFGRPVPKPAAVVVGGETTVTVVGKGVGGRNQEIALGAALKMDHMNGAVILSVNTDGIDGPTDAAGALADGETLARSRELSLDAEDFLMHNDSYTFFSKLGDLIFTGPTGTNVNDVLILVVV